MTRIAVVSDSHGDFRFVGKLRAQMGGRVDWLLHAGDHVYDAPRIANNLGVDPSRVRAVAGNCDHPAYEPVHQVVEVEGVRILITHGHHHGVKESYQRVLYRGLEEGAQIVIFGHSHVPLNVEERGILLFNPGSLSQPRIAGDPPSAGLIQITQGNIDARVLYLR